MLTQLTRLSSVLQQKPLRGARYMEDLSHFRNVEGLLQRIFYTSYVPYSKRCVKRHRFNKNLANPLYMRTYIVSQTIKSNTYLKGRRPHHATIRLCYSWTPPSKHQMASSYPSSSPQVSTRSLWCTWRTLEPELIEHLNMRFRVSPRPYLNGWMRLLFWKIICLNFEFWILNFEYWRGGPGSLKGWTWFI